MPTRRLFVGVDIGGTFTDLVIAEEPSGALYKVKTLTTPSRPADAVIGAVREALQQAQASPSEVERLVHATTLATNLVLERKGARLAYLTTEGFGAMFQLGKQRPAGSERFNPLYEKPEPLVSREMVFEIRERLDARGEVLVLLDLAHTEAMLDELAARQPASVAICLLHSYANPAHEQRLAELVRARLPGVYVALSSEIWPEFQEYERASTTVVSAYVGPMLSRYVGELAQELRALGIGATLQIMQSGGAVMPAAAAARRAVHSVESGPAAGVIMAADLGRRSGWPNILSFDMGGTTAKVGLVRHHRPTITHDFRVGGSLSAGQNETGEPIKIPVIDLAEVGAGGGSIAWIDSGGFLRVGPQSAGASPGPACYGLGGEEPTVTDANVVLGYLNPDYFLGGRMRIHPQKSREAIERAVARKLSMDLVSAAHGIYELANVHMGAAVRVITVQRGIDPREFAVAAFGGAGPIHIVKVAEEFRIPTIAIPPSPGLASALGLLTTDIAYDYVTTRLMPCSAERLDEIRDIFAALETSGRGDLQKEGLDEPRIELQRTVDVRFVHQRHELTVPVPPGPLDERSVMRVEAGFRELYFELFGVRQEDPCVLVNFGVRAVGRVDKPRAVSAPPGDGDPERARKGAREAYFAELQGFVETPVYERTRLQCGDRIRGPAIFEEPDSTAICPPGYAVEVDAQLNLVITRT